MLMRGVVRSIEHSSSRCFFRSSLPISKPYFPLSRCICYSFPIVCAMTTTTTYDKELAAAKKAASVAAQLCQVCYLLFGLRGCVD